MGPVDKASALLNEFEQELKKQVNLKDKDYSVASHLLNQLFRVLIEKPEGHGSMMQKLYDLCHEQFRLDVLAINFPACPSKKDGSNVNLDDIYSRNFDEIVNLEKMLKLKTIEGKIIYIDLERLSKDDSYLQKLKEESQLDAASLEQIKYVEDIKNIKEKLDFILKFDVDDLMFFKGMDEQVEIAKMKKRLFSSKGLTVDLTTPELLQLPPMMAGIITRLTTLCHWGTQGPERFIFANTKENIDNISKVLQNEEIYKHLKRFTILGCATTSREALEDNNARLFVYNGPISVASLEKINKDANLQEPSYLFNFYVDDKTKDVKLTLMRLPYFEMTDILLDFSLDIREFYNQVYSILPPKAQKQFPSPDKDISKIAGTVKNMFNMLSPKNNINMPTVPPNNMNPLFTILKFPEMHNIIYKDCGKKAVNGAINLHLASKKQKAILHQKDLLTEKGVEVENYQAGRLNKEERSQLKAIFPAMGKGSIKTELRNISPETLDLARLAEITINTQRTNAPIEVKGYTVPVTKAKEGDYIVPLGTKERITDILAEDIPKSITLKTRS